jgi:hypothetical protein
VYWFLITSIVLALAILGVNPCFCCGCVLGKRDEDDGEHEDESDDVSTSALPKTPSSLGTSAGKGLRGKLFSSRNLLSSSRNLLSSGGFLSSSGGSFLKSGHTAAQAGLRTTFLAVHRAFKYELRCWQKCLFASLHLLLVLGALAKQRVVLVTVACSLVALAYNKLFRIGKKSRKGNDDITFYKRDVLQETVGSLKSSTGNAAQALELDNSMIVRVAAFVTKALADDQASKVWELMRWAILFAGLFVRELAWLFSIWFELFFSAFIVLKGFSVFDPDTFANLELAVRNLMSNFRQLLSFLGGLGDLIADFMQQCISWAKALSFGFAFAVAVPSDCPGLKLLMTLCTNLLLLIAITVLVQSESLRRFRIMSVACYENTTATISRAVAGALFYLLKVLLSSLKISELLRNTISDYDSMPNSECKTRMPIDAVVFYLLKLVILVLGVPVRACRCRHCYYRCCVPRSKPTTDPCPCLLPPPS